jgi:2-methylcitrate dehydratase PrpD
VDGRSETVRVSFAPGHPRRELRWDEIEQKFMDCAAHGGLPAAQAARAFAAVSKLEENEDVGALVRLMTTA